MASAVLMDKVATKRMLGGSGIPLLTDAVVDRPETGLPSAAALETQIAGIGFPCCVKPVHLGSSIGVGKADTIEEVRALLGDRAAQTGRGAAGFSPEIPVGGRRRQQGRRQEPGAAERGHAVLDP